MGTFQMSQVEAECLALPRGSVRVYSQERASLRQWPERVGLVGAHLGTCSSHCSEGTKKAGGHIEEPS